MEVLAQAKKQPTAGTFVRRRSLSRVKNNDGQHPVIHSILGKHSLQPKLKIGQPNEKYEKVADWVADQVMSMPDPGASTLSAQKIIDPPYIQRLCSNCEEELQPKPQVDSQSRDIQRQEDDENSENDDVAQPKPIDSIQTPFLQRQTLDEADEEQIPSSEYEEEQEETTPFLDSVPTRDAGELAQPKSNTSVAPQVTPKIAKDIQSFKGSGRSLPATERAFFEPRFRKDFSNVRVYTDNRAEHAARSINARAFTLGRDVVFGSGQFSPGTRSGKFLLAHELTHVLQQNQNSSISSKMFLPSPHIIQRAPAKGSTSLNAAQIKKLEALWSKYKTKYASTKGRRSKLYKLLNTRTGIRKIMQSMKQAQLIDRAKYILAIRLVALSIYGTATRRQCIDSVHHLLMKQKQLLGKKFSHFEWGRIIKGDIPHPKWRRQSYGWRQRGHMPVSSSFPAWRRKINLKLKKPLHGTKLNISDLKVGRAIIWDFHRSKRGRAFGHAIGIVHVDTIKKYMVVTWGTTGGHPVDLRAFYIGTPQSYVKKNIQTPLGKLELRRWKGFNAFGKSTKEYFLAEHK